MLPFRKSKVHLDDEMANNAFMHREPVGTLKNELRRLIFSVGDWESRLAEENMNGEQVQIALMHPHASLFVPAKQTSPAIYPALRNWLD